MSQNHTTEELEDLYAQLLARSPALAWIKDAQHRLIFINPAFGEAFNIDRDAWLGKSVWDLFPEEQARAIAANDTRIQNADETESVVETVTYGGRSYHYLSYKYPLPQPDEKRFLGGVSVDITREVEAERALTQAVTRLQQEATLRDRLLGLFSHDVRGPLVNIVETVRGLTDDDDPIEMEDLKILLPMIQEQASETLELISEVLSWVRMNLNATHLPQRVLPLLPRVQQICQRLDGHARARQVRFALEDLEQARVQSNGGLVERVLTNVLSNALKYSPPGGIVAVSAAARDGAVEVYVDDDGPGIPDEAIVLLEGGECQTPRRGASGEIGRGIGLALCQDLMRRNGGHIRASRRIGGGTRFVIRLPAVPAPQRLRRISYLSEATQPLSPEALSQLLRVARARNEAAGLSGVLMHSRSRFFQVLEGPHDALHATMERIYRDRRHKNVELILDVEVEHPGYQGWALQFTRIDDDLIERIRHGGPSALEDILPARR